MTITGFNLSNKPQNSLVALAGLEKMMLKNLNSKSHFLVWFRNISLLIVELLDMAELIVTGVMPALSGASNHILRSVDQVTTLGAAPWCGCLNYIDYGVQRLWDIVIQCPGDYMYICIAVATWK